MSDAGVRADPPGNADAEAAVMAELDLVPDVRMTPAERYQFARNVVAVVKPRIAAQAARDERQAIIDLAEQRADNIDGDDWGGIVAADLRELADLLRGAETTGDKQ